MAFILLFLILTEVFNKSNIQAPNFLCELHKGVFLSKVNVAKIFTYVTF